VGLRGSDPVTAATGQAAICDAGRGVRERELTGARQQVEVLARGTAEWKRLTNGSGDEEREKDVNKWA
jgi:hypothetical protein